MEKLLKHLHSFYCIQNQLKMNSMQPISEFFSLLWYLHLVTHFKLIEQESREVVSQKMLCLCLFEDKVIECSLVNCFSLRWIMTKEEGSQFTEHQQGSSSALLRAEGEKELSPHVSVCLSPCPINLISLSTFIHTSPTCPCLPLSLYLLYSPPFSSLELSARPCQRNAELEHWAECPSTLRSFQSVYALPTSTADMH